MSQWLLDLMGGAQLQDVWTDGEVLVLEFYLQRNFWLCFDLQPQQPDVFLLLEKPRLSKKPKPVSLFLGAHGKNLRLLGFEVDEPRGRVIQFLLGTGRDSSERDCRIEVFLVPKNVNLSVEAGGKSVHWSKPRPLPAHNIGTHNNETESIDESIDWFARSSNWRHASKSALSVHPSSASSDPLDHSLAEERAKKSFLQQLEKKKKAVLGIQQQMQEDSVSRYFELGEFLKMSKEVPDHLKDLYDTKLSLSENRERCFQKAKSLRGKVEGTQKRLTELQQQIQQMQQALEDGSWQASLAPAKDQGAGRVLQKAQAKTRKLALSEGFEVVMGKSAKDNVAILRQARAWDLWFHLRDYPSAHAILFRNKNQAVPESVFAKVGEWLISETLSKKQISSGVKYAGIVTECRFVKPVKGSVGLVTYQNEKSFSFASK